MKRYENLPAGVKLSGNGKNYIVDVDRYVKRERYYQGDIAGVQLLVDANCPIMDDYNRYFGCYLDVVLLLAKEGGYKRGRLHCDDTAYTYKVYRRGYVVR